MSGTPVHNLKPGDYPFTVEYIHDNKVLRKDVVEGPGVLEVPGRKELIGDAEGEIDVIITMASGEVFSQSTPRV